MSASSKRVVILPRHQSVNDMQKWCDENNIPATISSRVVNPMTYEPVTKMVALNEEDVLLFTLRWS